MKREGKPRVDAAPIPPDKADNSRFSPEDKAFVRLSKFVGDHILEGDKRPSQINPRLDTIMEPIRRLLTEFVKKPFSPSALEELKTAIIAGLQSKEQVAPADIEDIKAILDDTLNTKES